MTIQTDNSSRCAGFLCYLIFSSGNEEEGREVRNSFLLKYSSYCKTLTVKTHTVAKRIQTFQWNSEFGRMLTNSHPLALLKIKTKFKTNHTARILISEIFLNKLSIALPAQLSLIISPGLSFCKDDLLRLSASLPQVGVQVRLTVDPSSPNHIIPFHRSLPFETG